MALLQFGSQLNSFRVLRIYLQCFVEQSNRFAQDLLPLILREFLVVLSTGHYRICLVVERPFIARIDRVSNVFVAGQGIAKPSHRLQNDALVYPPQTEARGYTD